MYNRKGITLVALVVTIIVLLILAGVTITSLLGDDGIIKKAGEATNRMNEAIQTEQSQMNDLMEELNSIMGGNDGEERPDTTAPTANISLSGSSATPGTAISATVTFIHQIQRLMLIGCLVRQVVTLEVYSA